MRTINIIPSSSDSFKYSILCSLHYYDISSHRERISKLKSYENRYNFTHNTPHQFEKNNTNISLTVYDENDKIIYHPINNSENKASIAKINNHIYHAIKPLQNKYIKLNKLLKTFSQEELSSHLLQILKNKIETNA